MKIIEVLKLIAEYKDLIKPLLEAISEAIKNGKKDECESIGVQLNQLAEQSMPVDISDSQAVGYKEGYDNAIRKVTRLLESRINIHK